MKTFIQSLCGKLNLLFIYLAKLLSRKGLNSFFTRELATLPAKSAVLLVGAEGALTSLIIKTLRSSNNFVETLDLDPAKRPQILADIQSTSLPLEKYDAILLPEVIEHVPNPQAAIATVFSALKSGGMVLLSTPFTFPLHETPTDYYRYTEHGLRFLLSSFSSVVIKPRNSWPEALLVLPTRLLLENGALNKILGALAALLAVVLWPLALICAKVFRTNFLTTGYVASAKKP